MSGRIFSVRNVGLIMLDAELDRMKQHSCESHFKRLTRSKQCPYGEKTFARYDYMQKHVEMKA